MRIRRNDFGPLKPPALGAWEPSMTVTVVVPAHGGQEKLDLTLAALSNQTYPARLLDVIVVDDGSPVPLRADLVPDGRVVRVRESWGRAAAVQAGADAATGEIVLVLDADMVPWPEHVEAQMRWHHLASYLVVLGWIDFTDPPVLPSPSEVAAGVADLFPMSPHRHDWAEEIIASHDGLRTAPSSLVSRVHVGATASYPAWLLRACGGMDTTLKLAEDTELGYRLTQAGAVFVPDPEARAWHVGVPTAMRSFAELKRYNDPFVADRVPYRRYLRTDRGRQWLVPYVEAVVEAGSYEDTRATVDGLLASSLPDVRVTVEGPWESLTDSRRSPLSDPLLELRLLRAQFEHDPRVRLGAAPEPVAPFRLLCPPGWMPEPTTVERLVGHLEATDGGALCVALEESAEGVVCARLERTAALARASLLIKEGEHADDVLDEVFGLEWVDGAAFGLARRPRLYPPRRRPVPEHERLARQRDKELDTLRERTAALRTEVAQLRREAAKGRRDTARWKEKAEHWRREAVKLAREQDRTVLDKAVRRMRNLTFPRR
ncbi:glycosyltransferase [Nonomuraea dietziae]|uniref:glycosyltransferase n=1 Tax=Nonomuraea dietziae TaxID=65515 RepID=UPI00343FF654